MLEFIIRKSFINQYIQDTLLSFVIAYMSYINVTNGKNYHENTQKLNLPLIIIKYGKYILSTNLMFTLFQYIQPNIFFGWVHNNILIKIFSFWIYYSGFYIITDAWNYHTHRLCHDRIKYPILWKIHNEHHKESINPISFDGFMQSPIEILFTQTPFLFYNMFVPLIPKQYSILTFYIIESIQIMGHNQYEIKLRFIYKLLGLFIISPHLILFIFTKNAYFSSIEFHRYHHKKLNINFGEFTSFWDNIYGTTESKNIINMNEIIYKYGKLFEETIISINKMKNKFLNI